MSDAVRKEKAMSIKDSRLRWLAALSTVLSLAVCYGTLAIVALLGVLGTAVNVDKTLWAGAIVAFASIATAGLGLGLARHRRPWPILVGGLGAATIGYAMYVRYDRLSEAAGFLLLSVAAIWDWRICRTPCSKVKSTGPDDA